MATEYAKIEFTLGENTGLNTLLIGSYFCSSQGGEELRPLYLWKLTHVLDGADRAVTFLSQFFRKAFFRIAKHRVVDLPLPRFILKGRGNTAAGRATRGFPEYIRAVIFESQVK